MGAAASSIPSSSSKKYDVFISFRGEDTRKNFTSHLHTALCQKNIETYIDYRLPRGEDISASLIQAIQDSTISVVVFSENYASSKWCLDELLHILHCRHYMGQIVIPVFYEVDPSHVRKPQKGSYKEAFAKHETDFIHNQDKLNKWRDALLETANLAGWNSQTCRVGMHNLTQRMGWNIVSQECIKDPGRRSRLWKLEEVIDVLENNHGTEAVEGIMFDKSQSRDICLSSDTFKNMSNLRYLKFYSSIHGKSCTVKLPSGLKSFSNKLVHLHWENYPLKLLPSTFSPTKLVVLRLEDSQVKKLWDGVQDIVHLREVNLSGCKNLLELPDFCKAEKLKIVELSGCENLGNVHPSITSLHTLITLILSGCKRLKSLQSESHLKSLANLYLDGCVNLKDFSLSSEKMTDLDLKDTQVDRLHSSIGRLNKLTLLSLSSLKHFPVKEFCLLTSLEKLSIYNGGQAVDEPNLQVLFDGLCSLKYLHLKRCSNMSTLPDNITNLLSLSELVLSGSNIESLPSGIKHLPNLKSIEVTNCKRVRSLPELPPYIVNFDANNCVSLETVATSTTLKHNGEVEDYRFFFQNCVNLDEHSLNMNLVQLLRQRVDYSKCVVAEVCYPGSIVPKWVVYKQTRGRRITVDIFPPFDEFKGFLFSSVISQFISKRRFVMEPTYRLTCVYRQVDDPNIGDETKWYSYWVIPGQKYDHVYIWYLPFQVKSTNTNSQKVSFELEFLLTTTTCHDFSVLITDCGVSPIYKSHNGVDLSQRKLKQD